MRLHVKDCLVLRYRDGAFFTDRKDVFTDGAYIKALGDTPQGYHADKVINGTGRLVMPGMINTHTHHYMSLFRNIANDVPFTEWLFDNMMPREDRINEEDCYWGTMLSLMEQIRSGATAFNDMYLIPDAAARAAVDIGSRAWLARCVVGDKGDDGGRMDQALSEIERWKGEELLRFTISPHAPYSCTDGYLRYTLGIAEKLDLPLHYHLSESESEVAGLKERHNMTPIEHADMLGLLDHRIILAHCVKATESDMALLAKPLVSVATNPASNMKLGNGFAPVPSMIKAGVNVTLGTDGPASNNALNMFRDMTLMALIQKGAHQEPTVVSANDALKATTVSAARAFGMEAELGQVEPGFLADFSIIDLDQPQLLPHNDIVSSLVYSAYGSEVETVVINGSIVMEDRHFTLIDEERVKYEMKKRTGAFD